MTALLIVVAAIVLLFIGYVFYGSWLAKQWGIDPTKKTPAIEKEDGVDYVAAKPAVLMGHHFSSIAGAGPINGPIQASIFGWVPVFLWCTNIMKKADLPPTFYPFANTSKSHDSLCQDMLPPLPRQW